MTEAVCFSRAPGPFPRAFDQARAQRAFEAMAQGPDGFEPDGDFRSLLESAFGNSPFLARLALREKKFLASLPTQEPQAVVDALSADVLSVSAAESVPSAMAQLRKLKRRMALAIALADIGGLSTVEAVTGALTRFADFCVRGALRFVLKEKATKDGLETRDPEILEATTGLVILAMGKQGAYELNYSSDIDLIVFYAPQRFPFHKRGDARAAAVDIVRDLVRLLSETTGDGYVFRVDLRLRPDAGATQVAISTSAAEAYYEAMGQNWERAAMIKARACAGDFAAAEDFLHVLKPFIWRKNLDYAAIEDIHSIKRQIHAHEGHDKIAIAGHNIKLGRGGIREIEFFAQTQQLIAGGRSAILRPSKTLAALVALQKRGLISQTAEREMREAYLFLRHLEHRLQMIEDEQTHTLPKSLEGLAHIACFAGFADVVAFSAVLTHHLETVSGHYSRLFERGAPLASASGSLVFTGVEDDPETLGTLAAMGFRDAGHVSGAIRAWHHGRIRAMRSARARELLTKLIPALLEALSKTADPDGAFAQFDQFLTRLPAGVQLFSLLLSNPHLLTLIADIAGSAPLLATHLARAPAIMDALMDPGFLTGLSSRAQLQTLLEEYFTAAYDYESALDAARRFAREQKFRIGLQLLEGRVFAAEAGPAFADIAECVVTGLLHRVEAELAQTAGRVPGGQFAVIAMGKLGGREMRAASDLDLIFVYDLPPDSEVTDGPKPLAVVVYYARLAQRLIAALTTPTAEGSLYDVDMRLRPAGNKGPVAVSLQSFARYHAEEAWTWERMALTRARVIEAPSALRDKVEAVIQTALTTPPDRQKILTDAREMRERIATEYSGRNFWDLKYAPGGEVDLEFIAQAMQLCEAFRQPQILSCNTITALQKLADAKLLKPDEAETLIRSAKLQSTLMQLLRIAMEGALDREAATPGLKALLCRADGAPDFAALEAEIAAAQLSTRAIFERLLPRVIG